MNRLLACAMALALAAAHPIAAAPRAAPAATPAAATKPWNLHFRYRYEGVDDAAFARDANAHTARLRAGYHFALGRGWSALLEGEGVVELNDRFNSGANGQTAYPVVGDARVLEVNQAWLDWRGATIGSRIGRQVILLDNGRHFANGIWRQNMQSFDAAQVQWKPSAAWDLQGFYIDRVHRSAGDEARNPLARERDLDARLLRVARTLPRGSLVGYGYWVEDQDVAQASSQTLGLHWSAAFPLHAEWRFGLSLEAATQEAWADATGGRTSYTLVEPRIERGPLVFRAGWERLGAGTGRAFQTPLGSLHAFNGWADKFLITTPIDGLEDFYLAAQGAFTLSGKAATWLVRAHDFQSDHGVAYGREWNAQLGLVLRPGLSALLKAADYQSDGFARDTRKLWFQLEWAL